MGKLAELSLQYFSTTPSEKLKADWESLQKYNQHGPDMLAVLNNYGRGCAIDVYYSCFSDEDCPLPITMEDFPHEYTDTELCLAA